MQEDRKKPHLADFLPFLIASSMVEKILASARFCHFGGVYTHQVWKSRSVQWGQTHRHTFFQTIYSNPPEGGGSIMTLVSIPVYMFTKLYIIIKVIYLFQNICLLVCPFCACTYTNKFGTSLKLFLQIVAGFLY